MSWSCRHSPPIGPDHYHPKNVLNVVKHLIDQPGAVVGETELSELPLLVQLVHGGQGLRQWGLVVRGVQVHDLDAGNLPSLDGLSNL